MHFPMLFTLHYRGQLRPNAKPLHKHELRQHFRRQLAQYWKQAPLSYFPKFLEPAPADKTELSVLVEKNGFTFAPLVSEQLHLVAELDVDILWPQKPGAIITAGGDIDNRLKTLLDSLRMPSNPSDLPPGTVPDGEETPFFCLLEDDSLVSRLNVRTDRLLEPVQSDAEVDLSIRVTTRQLMVFWGTIGLA
jgi:hypothetical protein